MVWTIPAPANLTKGEKVAEMHPFVSPKDNKIYFTAHNADYTDTKMWYINRLDNSWSNAIKLDSPINDDDTFYSNQSKNGDLYFTNISKGKMNFSPYQNGEFQEIIDVDIEFGFHGFISPNHDYLVVNAKNKEEVEREDNDIYVYFKKKDETWSEPINLGTSVNSTFDETCPSITPDGKYMFFSRYNEEGEISNFYWISSQVINNLQPIGL